MPEKRSLAVWLRRRAFIRWTATGLSLGAISSTLPLAACTPAPPTSATASAGARTPTPGSNAVVTGASTATAPGGARLPTYMAFQSGPKADLPANANGLDPAYFKFPSELARSFPAPPGDGSDVSAIVDY